MKWSRISKGQVLFLADAGSL